MNKHNAAQYLPLVIALSEGKEIEANRGYEGNPIWEPVSEDGEVLFTCAPHLYRVKE